jgi:hypothetical protein
MSRTGHPMRHVGFCVLLLLALAACTSRQLYESARHNEALECQKRPPSQYDECMKAASVTYEEYRRERRAVTSSPD